MTLRASRVVAWLLVAAAGATVVCCGSDDEASPPGGGDVDASANGADATNDGAPRDDAASGTTDGAIESSDGSDAASDASAGDGGADASIANLDPAFGTGGVVTTAIRYGFDDVRGLARQADGKILAIGRNTAHEDMILFRITTSGALDTTFNGSGAVLGPLGAGYGYAVAVQSDGHIVALSADGDGSGTVVRRFTSSGALDTAFGTNGEVSLANQPGGLVVQPDDEILVATGTYVFKTFGGTGTVALNLSEQTGNWSRPLAVQADDKILVGGRGIAAPVATMAVVARIDASGAVDATFDSDGYVAAPTGSDFAGIGVDGASRIVVLRSSYDTDTFYRFDATGAADATFGTGGVLSVTTQGRATSLVVGPTGDLVAGGPIAHDPKGSDARLVHITSTGTLDTAWGTNGIVRANGDDSYDYVRALAPAASGFFAAGFCGEESTLAESVAVTKHTSSGALDTTFGVGGRVVVDAGGSVADDIAIDSMGRIVVGGGLAATVIRLTANGALDTTFNGSGIRTVSALSSAGYNSAFAMALDASDRPILGGTSSTSAGRFGTIVRLATNGDNDTTFGTNGVVTNAPEAVYNAVLALAVQSDGKIIAAGGRGGSTASHSLYLARFATDGTPDPTFTATAATNDLVMARAVALQADGKILLAGYEVPGVYAYSVYDYGRYAKLSGSRMIVRRYDAGGTIDPTFAAGGTLATDLASAGCASPAAYALRPITSGGAYVAGICQVGANRRGFVVRVTAAGAIDAMFGTAGVYTTSIGTGENGLYALAFQTTGALLAGGYAYMNPTGNDFALLRFK